MLSRFLKDIDRGYMEMPTKESPFSAPKQSLWGESSSPRFMSTRQAPMTSHTQSTSRTYTTPSALMKNIISANSESPLLGPTRKSVGCDDENFSSPKESRLRVLRGEASPRRLVSANATGGASRVAQLSPGQLIEHERFGIGEVLSVEGTGENTKAHIRFKNAGEKQLLLKFARFRVLG